MTVWARLKTVENRSKIYLYPDMFEWNIALSWKPFEEVCRSTKLNENVFSPIGINIITYISEFRTMSNVLEVLYDSFKNELHPSSNELYLSLIQLKVGTVELYMFNLIEDRCNYSELGTTMIGDACRSHYFHIS